MHEDFSMESYQQEFISRLRTFRNERNISAREMSLSLGQNVNYINLIENGKRLPSMQGFFLICDYLKIAPCNFFEKTDSKFSEQTANFSESEESKQKAIKEIRSDIENLSETELPILRKMIHALV